MKRRTNQLLPLLAILGLSMNAKASDRWETLRAIHWVENPTNQTQVGRFGELGPYQFRPATWRMHTDKPFRMAVEREAADEVAVRHYEWIKARFERAGVDQTPSNIAMAWNCGVEAVLRGRIPASSYDYAKRVTNLVQRLKESSRPVATGERSQDTIQPELRLDEVGGAIRFRVFDDGPRFVLAAG